MSKAQWIAENLKPGQVYAGLILGENGDPDYHLVLLPGEADGLNFSAAEKWAKQAGGELPTRREQSLLIANCKKEFRPDWYWSGELNASGKYAFIQGFCYGGQDLDYLSYECRVRAVSRLFL